MNEVIKNIHERRSVRMYQDKAVPKDVMDEIINAGNDAPSGSNAQPWRFVVVEDKKVRERLVELSNPLVEKWIEKYANETFKKLRERLSAKNTDTIYYSAPAIIFVIGKGPSSPLDCPMVCENMMLAARSLGVGSCWVHFGQLVCDEPEVMKMLEISDGEKVYGPILLGYPKGDFPKAPPKKEPVVKRI
jgi:nitroreductase